MEGITKLQNLCCRAFFSKMRIDMLQNAKVVTYVTINRNKLLN